MYSFALSDGSGEPVLFWAMSSWSLEKLRSSGRAGQRRTCNLAESSADDIPEALKLITGTRRPGSAVRGPYTVTSGREARYPTTASVRGCSIAARAHTRQSQLLGPIEERSRQDQAATRKAFADLSLDVTSQHKLLQRWSCRQGCWLVMHAQACTCHTTTQAQRRHLMLCVVCDLRARRHRCRRSAPCMTA